MRLAAQRTRSQSGHGRFFRVALFSSESAFLIALIDSGASDNFISASLVAYLRLRVKTLPTPCNIRAANGGLMHCTHYVVVRASLGELRFTLTPRVVPTDLRVILPPSPSRGGGEICIRAGSIMQMQIMHYYAFLGNLGKNEKIKGRICVFTRKTIMQVGKNENLGGG